MPKFPEPPGASRLADFGPEIFALRSGTLLWRVYFRRGRFPSTWDGWRSFGPTARGRFDHHLPPPREQERAVYYAAGDLTTCLAEVFQAKRLIEDLHEPWVVAFETARPLRLLDLTGAWPTRAGASMAIASGLRSRAQRWSRAIHGAYPELDGVWYPSSMHSNRPAVVLYERARGALPAAPAFHRALTDPVLRTAVVGVARRLNYAVGRRCAFEPG